MAGVTKDQTALIRRLTRRANRRIERAKGGQKTYLESLVAGGKFSAATKGMTKQQAAAQIKRLERFLMGQSSTKRGWVYTDFAKGIGKHTGEGWYYIKKEIVHKAVNTLAKQGYSITDQELAEILIQIDAKDKQEYYRVINLVEAKKNEDPGFIATASDIKAAIEEKITYQQAMDKLIKSREK